MVLSLDREKELSRCVPKPVDCRGSLGAWNDRETFSTQAFECALIPRASHLTKRHSSTRFVCGDIR